MSGSIPKEFIRDIIDMTDIVSLIDSIYHLKDEEVIIGDNVLFVMMEIILLSA